MASTYCSISLSGSWATEAGVEARARQDGSWTEDQRCHHFGLQEHHSDPSGLCRNFSPIFHEMFNDCFHRVNLTRWVEKGKERSKVKGMLDQWMELLRESGTFGHGNPWAQCVHISLADRELELELAQTKLALVETECKNQDLTHRFTVAQVWRTPASPGFDLSQIIRISREPPVGLSPTLGCPRLSVPSRKWLVRTSISIVVFLIFRLHSGSKGSTMKTPESMKKSSSEQAIGSNGKWS